jgi:hypothetical protein
MLYFTTRKFNKPAVADLPLAASRSSGFTKRPRDAATGKSRLQLTAGMYFAVPGAGACLGRQSSATTIAVSFFQIGGPIEETGRLRYIDGRTDSLLIPPVLRGDACLNLLHIPPGTRHY